MKKASLADRLAYAVAWVHGRSDLRPVAGVVLGSGLGRFAETLEKPTSIPYAEIPEFPVSKVPGHAGRLVLGELPGASGPVPMAVLQGRVHGYEGWAAEDVAFGVRVLGRLGVSTLWITNAAGGVNPAYQPGDLVRIADHLNLTGESPLTGPNLEVLGPRFPDMSASYDAGLGAVLEEEAHKLGVGLASGVYAGLRGPSYETPAEIRMLARLGADLVGMSTVHEVIAARHMGLRTAAVSLVTNRAAGLGGPPLTHADVERMGVERGELLARLLAASIPRAR